jgi:uncharacterized protein (TIGR03435 family)
MATSPAQLTRTVGFLPLLVPLVVGSLPLSAQSQSAAPSPAQAATASQPGAQPSLRFDVVSIRPRQSGANEPSSRQMFPGGRFVATGTTVRTLIRIAFATDDNLISGAPNWIDNETFDITAITANHTEVTTPQQFQQLMLSLLEDRFQFRFHRGQKETPVYWLELVKPGKPGPDLKPVAPDSQPSMSTNSNGSRTSMKASKMSMADIAAALRRQAGRPVEDHTDLKGEFDFQIEWAPEETPDSADPSLFSVLREQLGLKLRPAKGTTETIIIDQIAQPSAN